MNANQFEIMIFDSRQLNYISSSWERNAWALVIYDDNIGM